MKKFNLSKPNMINLNESSFMDIGAVDPSTLNLEGIIIENLRSFDAKKSTMAIICLANLSSSIKKTACEKLISEEVLLILFAELESIYTQNSINSITAIHSLAGLAINFGLQEQLLTIFNTIKAQDKLSSICSKVYVHISSKIQQSLLNKEKELKFENMEKNCIMLLEKTLNLYTLISENLNWDYVFTTLITKAFIKITREIFCNFTAIRGLQIDSGELLVDSLSSITTLYSVLLENREFCLIVINDQEFIKKVAGTKTGAEILDISCQLFLMKLLSFMEDSNNPSYETDIVQLNQNLNTFISSFTNEKFDNFNLNVKEEEIIQDENKNALIPIEEISEYLKTTQIVKSFMVLLSQFFESRPIQKLMVGNYKMVTPQFLANVLKVILTPDVFFNRDERCATLNYEIESMIYCGYSALTNTIITALCLEIDLQIPKEIFNKIEAEIVRIGGFVSKEDSKTPVNDRIRIYEVILEKISKLFVSLLDFVQQKGENIKQIINLKFPDLNSLFKIIYDGYNDFSRGANLKLVLLEYMSHLCKDHNLITPDDLVTFGELLKKIISNDQNIVIVSKCVGAIIDTHSEDTNIGVYKQLELNQFLEGISSTLDTKIRDYMKTADGEEIDQMDEILSNLGPFIEYKSSKLN